MIRGLLLSLALISSFAVRAQPDKVFFEFDLSKSASFPGGRKAMREVLSAALSYPDTSLKSGVGGPAELLFIVEHDGAISNLRAIAPDSLCSRMLCRAAQEKFSRWIPAEANGRPVRQLQCLLFYFHPAAGKVYFIGEKMPDFYSFHSIDDFLALQPDDLYKYKIRTTAETLPFKVQAQQIPEAARKARVNAQVNIRFYVNQLGVLEKTEALNDPGYGLAEAAIAYGQQFKYWIPDCLYDTCMGFIKEHLVQFRSDSAGLANSTQVFEISEIPGWHSKGVLDKIYISQKQAPHLKRSIVTLQLIVEKDGAVSAPQLSGSADSLLLKYVKPYLSSKTHHWLPYYYCNAKVRTRQIRYFYYDPLVETLYILDRDPVKFPPPDLERVYRPEETDVPPRHQFGDYALRNLHRNIWEYPEAARAAGIEGTVRMFVVIRPNGSVNAEIDRGLAGVCDQLALRIVRDENFKFTPAYKNGYPVSCRIEVEIPFLWINKSNNWQKFGLHKFFLEKARTL